MEKIHTHIPASTTPTHQATGTRVAQRSHPVRSTERSRASCTRARCVPQNMEQLLPDAEAASADFPFFGKFAKFFFFILLYFPSIFPGRRYSWGENKLSHSPLCTSCMLMGLLNPIHRHNALQTSRQPSCEVSGGCCQQSCRREASDLDFVKCSKTF